MGSRKNSHVCGTDGTSIHSNTWAVTGQKLQATTTAAGTNVFKLQKIQPAISSEANAKFAALKLTLVLIAS